jgi:hypothetical protein
MTAKRDLKARIRARQEKTGESYTAARAHVLREQALLLGTTSADPAPPDRLEAAVLKIGARSARLRILGERSEITFRSSDFWDLVPGQIATLVLTRRWTFGRDNCASGRVVQARVDLAKLGLTPLPLVDQGMLTQADLSDPSDVPDTYAQLEERFAPKPRHSYEFDAIAFGERPDVPGGENLTNTAGMYLEDGDYQTARELVMEELHRDLRILDAHAVLGRLAFDHHPARALQHYEMGARIGELSLPRDFDGYLPWGFLYNRPYLRCLHGMGLCLWRLERYAAARAIFERMLALNPGDNQGARFCLEEVMEERRWEEAV